MQTIRGDGDSFIDSAPNYVTDYPTNIFTQRVADYYGLTPTYAGVGGSEVVACWNKIKSEITPPTTYDMHIINSGFNDMRQFGNISGLDKDIANHLRAIIAYLRLASIVTNSNASVVYSSGWTTTTLTDSYSSTVHQTATVGSYAEYTFTGTAVSVGFQILADHYNPGVMKFSIDGVMVKTNVPSNECKYPATNHYTSSAVELSGLSDATHALRITKTDATSNVIYLDWIGIPAAHPPIIIINEITKMRTDMYAADSPFNQGSDAAVLAVNTELESAIGEYPKEVVYVDLSSYDPNTSTLVETFTSVHPNDAGNLLIATQMIDAINNVLIGSVANRVYLTNMAYQVS